MATPEGGRRSIGLRWIVGGTVLVAIVAIVGSVAAAGYLFPPPVPPSALSLEVAGADTIELHVTDGNGDGQAPPGNRVLTSERFTPRVLFKIGATGGLAASEFCVWDSSERAIVLGHVMGCVDDVRILRPIATDCGGLDEDPDAASLATAILSKPGIGAEDRGGLVDGGVPASLFLGTPTIRVLHVPQDRPFDGTADDPDGCRLLMAPDDPEAADRKATDGDDAIEIRGDMAARYVLLDVAGELVVIRAGVGGHDAPSGIAARERGYGTGSADDAKQTIWHMLQAISEIRFVGPG